MSKLHINHLYLAVEALNYLQLEGFFDLAGDWHGRADEVEKAKTGLRAEIMKREEALVKRLERENKA